MRWVTLGLVLLLAIPGGAAALPAPDPSSLPNVGIQTNCISVTETTETTDPMHPEPPPRQWKNVSVDPNLDGCVAPLVVLCAQLGLPCCAYQYLCSPQALVTSVLPGGSILLHIPGVGDYCVSYGFPSGVETRSCYEPSPPKSNTTDPEPCVVRMDVPSLGPVCVTFSNPPPSVDLGSVPVSPPSGGTPSGSVSVDVPLVGSFCVHDGTPTTIEARACDAPSPP